VTLEHVLAGLDLEAKGLERFFGDLQVDAVERGARGAHECDGVAGREPLGFQRRRCGGFGAGYRKLRCE